MRRNHCASTSVSANSTELPACGKAIAFAYGHALSADMKELHVCLQGLSATAGASAGTASAGAASSTAGAASSNAPDSKRSAGSAGATTAGAGALGGGGTGGGSKPGEWQLKIA